MGKQAQAKNQPPPKKEPPRQRPKPKAKGDEEEQKTKKQIEEEQRQLLDDNERKRAEFYEEKAAEKLIDPKGIEESVTYIEDKDSRKPKAIEDLSDFWREDLGMLPFLPSDNVGMDEDLPPDVDPADRIAFLEIFKEQLQQLLKMKFHIFWSQVIYDVQVRKALDSYLRFCLRSHDVARSGKGEDSGILLDEGGTLSTDISRYVLAVFLRLSKPEESPQDFMSSRYYGDTILEYRIFDIPKLIDICAIYGDSNRATVTRIVHSVFTHQPRFKAEFEKAVVDHMIGSLHQFCLPLQHSGSARRPNSIEIGIDECLQFLPDVLSCFNAVFGFFPQDCIENLVSASLARGSSRMSLDDLMVLLHDSVLALEQRGGTTKLGDIKSLFLTIRMLVSRLLSCILGFQMAPRKGPTAFDELLEWCKKHESDRSELLLDLGKHGLDNVAMEWHVSAQVDEVHMEFLEQLCGPMLPPEARTARKRHAASAVAKVGAAASSTAASSASVPKSSSSGGSASDAAKIREVREFVGNDFGEGFILQCLLHYGFNVHSVVNAIMDKDLPPQLETLPRKLKLNEAPPSANAGESGKLSADDKRRIADQTSRMAKEEVERERKYAEAKQTMASKWDEYDDEYVDSDTPMAGNNLRVAGFGPDADSDGEDESGDSSGEDGGQAHWGPDRGKGGKIKGKGKGKGYQKGPVQGQTVEARRKEANKSRVGNHNRRDGAMKKMAQAQRGFGPS
jgi:hypothetical protein